MLLPIAEFARKTIPGLQPGFGPKKVKWKIVINKNSITTVVPFGSGDDGGVVDQCPEYPANLLQSGGKSQFLVETLQVMFLLLDKKDDPEKFQAKHRYFIEMIKTASSMVQDLQVAADFFSDMQKISTTREYFSAQGANPQDKAFFTI